MAALIMPTLLFVAASIRRRQRSIAPAPLPLAVNNRSNVQQAHHGRDNGVRDDMATVPVSGQLQAQPAVDHSQDDGDAADADVSVRHSSAAAVLLEVPVVQDSAKRLREQDDEEDDADDGVCVGEVLAVDGNPDADAEGDDVDEEGEHLEDGVHPDEAGEAGYADEDASDREEADES